MVTHGRAYHAVWTVLSALCAVACNVMGIWWDRQFFGVMGGCTWGLLTILHYRAWRDGARPGS